MAQPQKTPTEETTGNYTTIESMERYCKYERPTLNNVGQCITEMMTLWKKIPNAENSLKSYNAARMMIEQLPPTWKNYARYQLEEMVKETAPNYDRKVNFGDFVIRLMTRWVLNDTPPDSPVLFPYDDLLRTSLTPPLRFPLFGSHQAAPLALFPAWSQYKNMLNPSDIEPRAQLGELIPEQYLRPVSEKRKSENPAQNQPPNSKPWTGVAPPSQQPNPEPPQKKQNRRRLKPPCFTCKKNHNGPCKRGTPGCYHCGRISHIRKYCPELSQNPKPKSKLGGSRQPNPGSYP